MRYLIQFSKQGNMRYISHLDLFRLFKRGLKRMGIKLAHSQGFNPHPKMSFVQPLSLGYTSTSEYLEVETIENHSVEAIVSKLNEAMPTGVEVRSCRILPPSKKTLAATVEYGKYHLSFPLERSIPWAEPMADFLKQEQILVLKRQKKTNKMVEQDIRPMIYSAEPQNGVVDDNKIMLTIIVRAGSNCNLNPEVFLRTFCEFAEVPFAKELLRVEREDLYCLDPKSGKFLAIKELSFV